MQYEWDAKKNRQNRQEHAGVSFEMASAALEDEFCLAYKNRADEGSGEQRWISLGSARLVPDSPLILAVAHVYREAPHGEEITRIISARQADNREIRRYQAQGLDQS